MPEFEAILLQRVPQILLAAVPGRWLLAHCTPSWRIDDPLEGFQRMVNERRARLIADTVLAQERTFPNAIVLATDATDLELRDGGVWLEDGARFLVVDGQHRLWAQQFSEVEVHYACVLHLGLDERQMAELFLEINDNQKRVPSSLRWDLVRLVETDVDVAERRAVDIVFSLATEPESPLFQRVDLTGEQPKISLKQGSLAPDIKRLMERGPLSGKGFELQYHVLLTFFSSLKEVDPDGWLSGGGPFYQARVIRALLQLLPRLLAEVGTELVSVTALDLAGLIGRIEVREISTDRIRERQGNAGIAAIRKTLGSLIFGDE